MGAISRLFLIFLLLPMTAEANQRLNFQEPETRREKQAISFSQNKGLIAKIDLNNDLIDEYIVRSCDNKSFCNHTIIAFKEFKPLKIGKFQAHKIVISHEKTYGIHDLIVYNQQYNDFAFETAIWNPFSFSFEIQ